MLAGDVLHPLGASFWRVHLVKYIFLMDICCQQFGGYIYWYWIYVAKIGGYMSVGGCLCALWAQVSRPADLMVVWPYGHPTLWSSNLMVIRPYGCPILQYVISLHETLWPSSLMVVWTYGFPNLWLSSENVELMVWPYVCPCWRLSCWWMSAIPLKSGRNFFLQENNTKDLLRKVHTQVWSLLKVPIIVPKRVPFPKKKLSI